MEHLTQENAAQYVGKTIYSSRPRFHYYPLRVLQFGNKYFVADRNHVAYRIPSENDPEGGIPFDSVKEAGQIGGAPVAGQEQPADGSGRSKTIMAHNPTR